MKSVKIILAAALLLAYPVLALSEEEPVIAHGDPAAPAINGPRVIGTTPGKPFLFLIPATGEAPLTYAAENLPLGLTLDPKTGIISGSLLYGGEYDVKITVSNPKGSATRKLKILGGVHKLAQTPPLGWNSWNVWGLSVSADKVKAAADAMVKSGLTAHGFSYVNIDDGWEKGHDTAKRALSDINALFNAGWDHGRDQDGNILTNDKFPDMKELADYLHSKGLKLGIYSSPGVQTCGRYEGSYGHELEDAKTYAQWGIDYLKYDWCTYTVDAHGIRLNDFQEPYVHMRKHLDEIDRDIVYSLCQYGMKKVWTWGAEVGGNLWRTTGDITDTWKSLSTIGFKQPEIAQYSGPGHWNDPDMLVVGKVGWGPTLHESKLNKAEQLTHITIWAMEAAPLLIGCDMTNMDQFTLDLLTNDDVLAIDQDPLGKAAIVKARNGLTEVWARPLFDGAMAVALFNKSDEKVEVIANWQDLGLQGTQPVRDLWQRKDLGSFDGSFKAAVLPHCAVMVKVGSPAE